MACSRVHFSLTFIYYLTTLLVARITERWMMRRVTRRSGEMSVCTNSLLENLVMMVIDNFFLKTPISKVKNVRTPVYKALVRTRYSKTN